VDMTVRDSGGAHATLNISTDGGFSFNFTPDEVYNEIEWSVGPNELIYMFNPILTKTVTA
jgi:hypothetical protein